MGLFRVYEALYILVYPSALLLLETSPYLLTIT